MYNAKRFKGGRYEDFSVLSGDWDAFLSNIMRYAG